MIGRVLCLVHVAYAAAAPPKGRIKGEGKPSGKERETTKEISGGWVGGNRRDVVMVVERKIDEPWCTVHVFAAPISIRYRGNKETIPDSLF